MTPLTKPHITGNEKHYIDELLANPEAFGQKIWSRKCLDIIRGLYPDSVAHLTASGTRALELAALILGLGPDDEIVMPSFTYLTTASSFVLCGAKIKFVDIRPDTMNIDENLIRQAIGPKTKAVVVIHYAGVSCALAEIRALTQSLGIPLIEDNAHGFGAFYDGKPLGSVGDISCFSFDFSKNITSGEGGMLLVNNPVYQKRAELLYELGTNRTEFDRGHTHFYEWQEVSSRFHLSELNAAFLLAQLEKAPEITQKRVSHWNRLYEKLRPFASENTFELPQIPAYAEHNAHIFYIKPATHVSRAHFLSYLKQEGIDAAFHYVPLHSSTAGLRYGSFSGEDRYTTPESRRLVRLPMYTDLGDTDIDHMAERCMHYFAAHSQKGT